MKIWSHTFGCKVNQYETELLRHRMSGPETAVVDRPEEADLCLINSCSVTAFADKECRQLIRQVLRRSPHARVVVTGCYATRAPKDIEAISERIEVYTNEEKDNLPSCLGFEISDKPLGIHQFAGHSRAFLKIQDGCRAPCHYCIIPQLRSEMWSKPFANVRAEMEALLANDYQEVVLTGIRLGLYRDKNLNLLGLLKNLVALPDHFRLRLSSLEVTEVTSDLIDFVKDTPKVCRHFHIPMQSGSSAVLKSMGRWYDAEYYEGRVVAARRAMPDCGITSDVMVGYPTETDEQFLETCHRIERMELSGLHVFRFSAREGTEAARLKPLDPRVITRRAHILGELDKTLKENFFHRFEGTEREVLPEPSGEGWTDNYIRTGVKPDDLKTGLKKRPVKRYNPPS